MTRSVSCRVCDVMEKFKITWLSAPFWILAAAFVLLSPFVWPLVLLWPLIAVLALMEAIRYAVCSACKIEFDPHSGTS